MGFQGIFKTSLQSIGAALVLAACAPATGVNSSNLSSANAIDPNAFAITSFSPAAGYVSAAPTTITVGFNDQLLSSTAGVLTYYNLSCNGSTFAASSVSYVAGSSTVSVSFPSIGSLTAGSTCIFSVSSAVTNPGGESPWGGRSVSYTLSQDVSVASGSASASAGGSGGTLFSENASTGLLLSGINVRGGTYVNAVQGLWQDGFSSGGTIYYGGVHGDQSQSLDVSFSCPAGYRVTGLKGRAGTYVNSIGIVCKNQGQSLSWESAQVGGSGGGAFAVSCPAGTYARGLAGRSGGYLDQIALICQ